MAITGAKVSFGAELSEILIQMFWDYTVVIVVQHCECTKNPQKLYF